jgi:hypothetical protein
MKLILILSAFISFSTPALADVRQDFCNSTTELGINIMTARQLGMPLERILDSVAAVENQAAEPLVKAIIADAYAMPIYDSAEAKQLAIISFASQLNEACNDTLE